MANKTVYLRLPNVSGTAGLTMILCAQPSGSIANGSGDTLDAGSNGLFSCVVDEAITGWFDVIVKNGSTVIAQGGKLYIESDVEGSYIVDNQAGLYTQISGIPAETLEAIEDYLFGAGARTVTITVNDGATAIQGARVRLTKGAESFVGTTNVSGVVTLNCNDGMWTVAITASGYSYAGTTIVVDGNETATYSMTATVIEAPVTPGLCTVRFEVRSSNGTTLIQGATVSAIMDQNCVTDGILVTNSVTSGTTNASGICDLVLIQGASIIRGSRCYTITVTDPDNDSAEPLFNFHGIIPNSSTAYASELIPR